MLLFKSLPKRELPTRERVLEKPDLVQELEGDFYALFRFFQLEQVCSFRQEVVVHASQLVKVHARHERKRSCRVRTYNLDWALTCLVSICIDQP